ncbi:MAG: 2-oxoacid:acceptor oxidoreductase family protein [bacterium]
MISKAIFAGFGGQGILMMGYTLAYAAMKEDRHVTYLPSYGAEVRGGTANCTIAVGNEDIASPIASAPDFLVLMNAPSLDRFQSCLRKGGRCLVNTSLIHEKVSRRDIRVYEVPATEKAEQLGDIRAANMVMLGAFLKVAELVRPETVLAVIERNFAKRPELLERNRQAFWEGYHAIGA